jgi:hypothetical protein
MAVSYLDITQRLSFTDLVLKSIPKSMTRSFSETERYEYQGLAPVSATAGSQQLTRR